MLRRHLQPVLLAILLLWSALSTLWATNTTIAQQHIRGLLLVSLIYLALRLLPLKYIYLQWVLSLFIAVQSVVALAQFILQRNVGLQWLGEPAIFPVGGHSVIPLGDEIWLRAYGLTPHPNILGGWLAICLLLLLPAAITASQKWRRRIHFAVFMLGLCALTLTFSRSAGLALAIGLSFFFFRSWQTVSRQSRRRLKQYGLTLALISVALGIWLFPLLSVRLHPRQTNSEWLSINERTQQLVVASALIQAQPLHGVGIANFVQAANADFRATENPQPVHNTWLLVSAELGIPAGFLWMILALRPIIRLLRKQQQRTLWQTALIAALIAIIIVEQFDMYTWQWSRGRLLRWSLWAITAHELA